MLLRRLRITLARVIAFGAVYLPRSVSVPVPLVSALACLSLLRVGVKGP